MLRQTTIYEPNILIYNTSQYMIYKPLYKCIHDSYYMLGSNTW